MRLFRPLISFIAGAYALAMLAYLLLRLVLGDSPWWLAFLNNFTPYYFIPGVVLILVALLFRAKRGILLLLPVLLIGLIWYGPRFMPKANAAGDAPMLKIISFNVLWVNKDIDTVEAWLREQDADIVLLQEMHGNFVEQLGALYPYYSDMPIDHHGNMILSRYPTSRIETLYAPDGSGHVAAQRFTVEVDGREIAVYNVHLTMPTGEVDRFHFPSDNGFVNLLRHYDTTRRDGEIALVLERAAAETLPVIMGGDFNLSDHTVTYGRIADQLRDSFREAGTGLGVTWGVAELIGAPAFVPPLLRIDYVWHSDDFHATHAAVGPMLGSDHLPVVVELVLSR